MCCGELLGWVHPIASVSQVLPQQAYSPARVERVMELDDALTCILIWLFFSFQFGTKAWADRWAAGAVMAGKERAGL